MAVLFLDFETRSAVDIKKSGAEVYARHPSTDILCMGYAVDDGPAKVWTHNRPTSELMPLVQLVYGEGAVVAHNAAFELAIWNCVFKRRCAVPELKSSQVHCTMAMAYSMALPGALADAAPASGLTIQKDSVGHRVMMQLSQPRTGPDEACPECAGSGGAGSGSCWCVTWWTPEDVPEKFEKLYAYCAQDIEVERELYKRLLKLSPRERELWILDRKINDRGVKVDVKAAKVALSLVKKEKKRFDEEIRELTQGQVATVSATGQFLHWLKFRGIQVESIAKADVADLLADPGLPADVRQALALRQEAAKSSTAKLEAMLKGVCEDGRLRGMFQYHGAGATGRFAGRRVQLHNLPRPKLSQAEIDSVFSILERVK